MKLEKARRVLLVLLALLLVGLGQSLAQGPEVDEEEPVILPHPAEGSPLFDLLTAPLAPPESEGSGPGGPRTPGDLSQQTDLDEWSLPINVTDVLYAKSGVLWFASLGTKTGAQSDGAIGKLSPATSQVDIYTMTGRGNIWALAEGTAGVLWYSTLNAGYVGRFDPATNSVTQWLTPSNHQGITQHPDIAYDPASGDLWFPTDTSVQPDGIYRLTPGTNAVTMWNTSPYEGFVGLDLAPDGKIWFTFQQGEEKQGVGRLDPSTDQVTLWPTGQTRPTRVFAEKADEIWFTELDGNSISVLIPSANTLRRYAVPTGSSQPYALLRANNKTWFTEYNMGKIGRLDPAVGSPNQSNLQPLSFQAPRTAETLSPATFTVSPQTQAAPLSNIKVNPTSASGFREYALTQGTASRPLGIDLNEAPGDIWFAQFEAKRIGKLRSVVSPPGPVPSTPTLEPISNPEGDGSYQVCWSQATGATSYRLEDDNNASFSSPRTVYSGPNTCYNVVGQAGGTWHYRVQALNSNGPSDWSNSRSVKVTPPTPEPGSAYLPLVFGGWGLSPPPPPPGRVTVLPIDNPGGVGAYAVRWTATAEAEAYFLEEATDPSFANAQTIYTGTATSFQLTDQGPTRYYYRVKYRGQGGGFSDWSNVEWVDVLWEMEPNDDPQTQANGPLVSGLRYSGTFPQITDVVDSYYLEQFTSGRLNVYLSNIPAGSDYDLYLLNVAMEVVASSELPGNQEEHITTAPVPASKYYVQVINRKGLVSIQPYYLKVEH